VISFVSGFVSDAGSVDSILSGSGWFWFSRVLALADVGCSGLMDWVVWTVWMVWGVWVQPVFDEYQVSIAGDIRLVQLDISRISSAGNAKSVQQGSENH